ncbi:MAG: peptidyl-prolyl cis-trans isomerase [Candidatus Omnitrophota bacterium]
MFKKSLIAVAAVLLTAALCVCAQAAEDVSVLERILAVVNDEIVTEQDLQIVMAPVAAQYRASYTGQEYQDKITAARGEFLNKLIEDKLILSEAKRKQVIVKDPDVDETLAEVRNKFPSREVFLKAITDQGLTEKKLWDRFRDQLMTQRLVSYEVKSIIFVSPGEISEYYKAHPEEFVQPDRVKLQHILVRIGSRTDEDAKILVDGVALQGAQGKSFEELAKAYSEGGEAKEGGNMGWVEKGQLLGDIDQKVFATEPGKTTEPIKSSLGYHLFRVVERQAHTARPQAEVRDQIQDTIYKEKIKKRLDAWISGLKKTAYISIR